MPEYHVWIQMRQRCLNSKSSDYKHYGGRGISICVSWKKDFLNFYRDLGPRPAGYTIERIDNNGNYCPENCKWATRKEQRSNQRIINGWKAGPGKTLKQAAKDAGLSFDCVRTRVYRQKMSVEEALTKPLRRNNERSK